MTCTTFLHDGELNQPLPDSEVQMILDEVRKLSGQNWQVVPLPPRRTGLFRRKQPTYYGVYVYVGGCGPWQQINFWSADVRWSINLYQPLEVVAAYLLGMLGGLQKARRADQSPAVESLRRVHALVSEAASTGFNPLDGDWADRLFKSQGERFDVLRQHGVTA